ncbi:alpha/beta hydrolase [Rhodovastum sp. RN2-1]|uniref:Alpha/beta hydrolase n=1 Tax=Limobrevibacterium gyesilva TaxID=2991712 RepID=A0AA41YLP0_9PROT|nr:alpha/beta hydrolase [Limobrevibacterium gyesilva]
MLVHGVGADLESWDEVAAALAKHFTVVRADLRGHGRSGHMTTCHIDDFVGDLDGLLAEAGVAKIDLVGFSLGGLIAQHFAQRFPDRVRRLALISTVAARTPEERARVLQRADIVSRDGIAAVVGAAEDRWFTPAFKAANPDRIRQRLAQLQANDHPSYAAAYRVFAEADEGLDFDAIVAPTLVVTGENDIGSSPRMARLLHERIADSRLVILPELRHSVLIEAPGRIGELLMEFLSEPRA